MIHVYKSDTGQYVLVHSPTQTVIIDDDIESGFDRIHRHVAENHPGYTEDVSELPEFPSGTATPSSRARWALLALVIVLPFLWLAALHYAVSSVATDLAGRPSETEAVAAELATLREEVHAIGRRVEELAASAPAQQAKEPPRILRPAQPAAKPPEAPEGAR
ncbi:MAG TPA: hypothetical protein ENN80_07245 [Candidatus Hydrogenedentes bacterium]|nr:hypothetical protein [Candidatus Hydrogenedentota bacterium]